MGNKNDSPISFLDVDADLLQQIVSYDYTSAVLAELIGNNRSRIINYWRNGDEDLLPPWAGEEKRRKFSFIDLVWLGIVKILTDFGLEKKVIYVLKNEVFSATDNNSIRSAIEENRSDVENLLAHHLQKSKTQIRQILDHFIESSEKNEYQFTKIATYIFSYFSDKTPMYLLVNKDGNHFVFTQSTFKLELNNPQFLDFFNSPHVSIQISDVINIFLSQKNIRDEVKQKFFSEKEWELFWIIRKEKPESLTVVNAAGEKQLIKVTKNVYATLEHRLSEIITKDGYEEIIIKTQKGKIVNCKKTINVKQ